MSKKTEIQKIEAQPMTALRGKTGFDLLMDPVQFAQLQRVAGMYASSGMVPSHFQGNVANVSIALMMSFRMRVDPFLLMQQMFILHGRPGIQAQLLIALCEEDGPFSGPIQYRWRRDKQGNPTACQAYATHAQTGEVLEGTWITKELVSQFGWDKPVQLKGGGTMPSMWQKMPEQMFLYRAAAWFIRAYAPGSTMGLSSKEELEDQARAEGPHYIEATLEPESAPKPEPQDAPGHVQSAASRALAALGQPEASEKAPEPEAPKPDPEPDPEPPKQKKQAKKQEKKEEPPKRVQVIDKTQENKGRPISRSQVTELIAACNSINQDPLDYAVMVLDAFSLKKIEDLSEGAFFRIMEAVRFEQAHMGTQRGLL